MSNGRFGLRRKEADMEMIEKIFAIIMTAGSFIASVESIVKLVKFIIKKYHESE